MAKYTNMKDVAAAAAENGDLMSVTLGDLREALGYARLGVRVLADIGLSLGSEGLGYYPDWVLENNEVPRYENELRVFTKRSKLGDVVQAVLDPTSSGDERLREAASSDASTALNQLEQIRSIVCLPS